MIALQGKYDNGIIKLANQAPVKKADVIVIFPDVEKDAEKELSNEKARSIFDKYTGIIKREIDEKAERLEAIKEKYEGIS